MDFAPEELSVLSIRIQAQFGVEAWPKVKSELGTVLMLVVRLNEETNKWFPSSEIVNSLETYKALVFGHGKLLSLTLQYGSQPAFQKLAALLGIIATKFAKKTNSRELSSSYLELGQIMQDGVGL